MCSARHISNTSPHFVLPPQRAIKRLKNQSQRIAELEELLSNSMPCGAELLVWRAAMGEVEHETVLAMQCARQPSPHAAELPAAQDTGESEREQQLKLRAVKRIRALEKQISELSSDLQLKTEELSRTVSQQSEERQQAQVELIQLRGELDDEARVSAM